MEEAREGEDYWRFGNLGRRTYTGRQQHWMLPAYPPSPGLDPDGSEDEESSSGEGEAGFQGPVSISGIGSALWERQQQQGKRGRVTASSEAAILRLLHEVTPTACCSDDCCAICLEDFAAADPDVPLRAMPSCSHAFHRHCILKWLRLNAVCPVCRRQLPLSEEGDDEEEEEQARRRSSRTRSHYDYWLARVAHYTQQRGRAN